MKSNDNQPDDDLRPLLQGYDAAPPDAAFTNELLARLAAAMPGAARTQSRRLFWPTAAAIAALLVFAVVFTQWPRSTPPPKVKAIAQATQTRPLKRNLSESKNVSAERTDLELESLRRSPTTNRALAVESLDAAENEIRGATQFESLEAARVTSLLTDRTALTREQIRAAPLIVRAHLLSVSASASHWHIDRILKGQTAQSQLDLPATAAPASKAVNHQAIFFLDRPQSEGDTLRARILYRIDERETK